MGPQPAFVAECHDSIRTATQTVCRRRSTSTCSDTHTHHRTHQTYTLSRHALSPTWQANDRPRARTTLLARYQTADSAAHCRCILCAYLIAITQSVKNPSVRSLLGIERIVHLATNGFDTIGHHSIMGVVEMAAISANMSVGRATHCSPFCALRANHVP